MTQPGIVKTVAPVLVMAIALFMILDQLEIANNIVTITYAALIGAVALGMALAFGLGGREVGARVLESAYTKGQEIKDDVRRDVEQGGRTGQAGGGRCRHESRRPPDRLEQRPEMAGGGQGRPCRDSGDEGRCDPRGPTGSVTVVVAIARNDVFNRVGQLVRTALGAFFDVVASVLEPFTGALEGVSGAVGSPVRVVPQGCRVVGSRTSVVMHGWSSLP